MTHNPRLEIRPATIDDIKKFYGMDKLPFSAQCLAFFLDGELSGLGGVRFGNGYSIAFSDIRPDIRVSKMTIYRCALEIMKMVDAIKTPVVAIKNENLKSAKRLLESLGFVYERSDEEGDIYKYG